MSTAIWNGLLFVFDNIKAFYVLNYIIFFFQKRRFSWSDSDSQGSSSSKRIQEDDRGLSPSDSSSWLSSTDTMSSELEEDSPICINQNMTPEPKLFENSKLLVRQKTSSLTATGRPPLLVIPPSATDGSSLGMQDCSVSSTTPMSDPPVDTISKKDLGESVKEGPKNRLTDVKHITCWSFSFFKRMNELSISPVCWYWERNWIQLGIEIFVQLVRFCILPHNYSTDVIIYMT